MTKQTQKQAIVMVHPFDSQYYETQGDYLEERENILKGDEDLYILINKVEETRRRLYQRKVNIISTEECNPKPRMGWKELSRILKDYPEVVFCGAELHLKENGKPYTGCVLDAFEKTQVQNKWIYLAGCWTE